MPISHTNRKGQTYFLCQAVSKTGKPRYYFSKTEVQNTLEKNPTGYHIEESVNGVVSLVKDRKQSILPGEIGIVETALQRHPKGNNYRVSAKGKQITVYERIGPDVEELVDSLDIMRPMYSRHDILDGMRAILDKHAHFSPMLHFDLVNITARTFRAKRVTYVVSLPKWVDIGDCEPLQALVNEITPLLDADEYFELR